MNAQSAKAFFVVFFFHELFIFSVVIITVADCICFFFSLWISFDFFSAVFNFALFWCHQTRPLSSFVLCYPYSIIVLFRFNVRFCRYRTLFMPQFQYVCNRFTFRIHSIFSLLSLVVHCKMCPTILNRIDWHFLLYSWHRMQNSHTCPNTKMIQRHNHTHTHTYTLDRTYWRTREK